jgi:hypothetical protein
LVQGQGGFEFSAAGILPYFEDWKRGPVAEMGPKDNLETAPNCKHFLLTPNPKGCKGRFLCGYGDRQRNVSIGIFLTRFS